MKKLLAIGVFTLASLWLTPGTSSAGGTFGLFTQASCWPWSCLATCGCNKCCATICVKPYNAFSPTCSGTIYCDGFCPLNNRCGGFGIGTGGGYGTLPEAGPGCEGTPVGGLPLESQPTVGVPQGVNTSRLWQNAAPYYGPVQVGYTIPAYAPRSNTAQPMAVPYYWNSNGR